MYGALVLFEDQLIHIVEISYTALILTELIMVALTVVTWHRLMVVAELVSLLMYTATLLVFNSYFGTCTFFSCSLYYVLLLGKALPFVTPFFPFLHYEEFFLS